MTIKREEKDKRRLPYSVGRVGDKEFPVTRHKTLREAEKQIRAIKLFDAKGVHEGEYFIDGPEELLNPNPVFDYVKADVLGAYELAPVVERIEVGATYLVAIPPYRKGRRVPVMLGRVVELPKQGQILIANEVGGIISVRTTDLREKL